MVRFQKHFNQAWILVNIPFVAFFLFFEFEMFPQALVRSLLFLFIHSNLLVLNILLALIDLLGIYFVLLIIIRYLEILLIKASFSIILSIACKRVYVSAGYCEQHPCYVV